MIVLSHAFWLYVPIGLAFLLALLGLLLNTSFLHAATFRPLSLLPGIDFPFEFVCRADIALRCILFAFSLLSLLSAGFRDYTAFFPNQLRFSVFFDNSGLRQAISTLAQSDRAKLRIPKEWEAKKGTIIKKMNSDLRRADIPFQFSQNSTSGKGVMSFKVSMVGNWGSQEYRIQEADGDVTYRTEVPQGSAQVLYTRTELKPSEGNYINCSILDVLLRWGTLIVPEFRERYIATPTDARYYLPVVAATRIDVFPLPNFVKTIYLMREDDGAEIPIG